MLKKLDNFLNSITMYRLLAYGLGLLAFFCLLLSFMGTLTLPPKGLMISLAALFASTYATNKLFATIWELPTNSESWCITALILFFVFPPAATTPEAIMIFLAGVIAMASKFLVVFRDKHLFNPAAFAMGVLVLTNLLHPTWWIGSSLLWPFALFFGLLVVRKIHRTYLFAAFVVASLTTIVITSLLQHADTGEMIKLAVTASPLIFLGTIMLTEPATMPARKPYQILFAGIVGVLYAAQISIAGLYIYPEVALLIGNLFAFVVNPTYRLQLRLKEIVYISGQVSDYIFEPNHHMRFLPGQYLEWTLPDVPLDSRGNRRTFTIASSPTENELHLGVKFYEPSSTFKRRLRSMKLGDTIFAGQLAGNFTLPRDQQQKLLFIAGGVGITPFRSMVKFMLDSGQHRNVVLLYMVSKPEEVAYKDVFNQAVKAGICTVLIRVGGGPLKMDELSNHVPDWQERMHFLSGPNMMVSGIERTLHSMGVPRRLIKKDYFAGY